MSKMDLRLFYFYVTKYGIKSFPREPYTPADILLKVLLQ